jgi:hypothetical protein
VLNNKYSRREIPGQRSDYFLQNRYRAKRSGDGDTIDSRGK